MAEVEIATKLEMPVGQKVRILKEARLLAAAILDAG